MEIDEFTFPTTHPNNSPNDSPPLWRLSPTASPTPSYEEARIELKLNRKVAELGNYYSRKSCSFLEGKCLTKRSNLGGYNNDDQEQDKMDMLWEDLNHEDVFKKKRNPSMIEFHPKGRNDAVEYGCVPAPFKLVRTNNLKGAQSKKPSLLVLVKVLKRLFMLQQSAKKRSID